MAISNYHLISIVLLVFLSINLLFVGQLCAHGPLMPKGQLRLL
jgi:hypothetical protein